MVNERLTTKPYIAHCVVSPRSWSGDEMEDDMIGILKRSWWLGPFVVSFAVATIATVQATITIGGAVIHATSAKPPVSQDPQLYAASSFEERWPPAFSTSWQRLPRAVSRHD
jgi:hypothetical protein